MGSIKNNNYSLQTRVATSTLKDSYQAGIEIGEKIIQKVGPKPNFILLFATLHYGKYDGGFKKLIEGLYNVIPENTPLAGGTVPGFYNSDGCYARGVTGLAVNYPNLNVTIGFGKNTKRNPKKAARQAVKMIKSNLKKDFDNNFIFSFISGPINPHIPGVKNNNIINSKIIARVVLSMFSFMQKVFQKGFGNEDIVLENVIKKLPDFSLIHSTSYAMPPFNENYQFCNKKILNNYAVFLTINTDLDFDLDFASGAEITDKKLTITKTNKYKNVIKSLNNNNYPLEEYRNTMGWDYNTFQDFKWTDITGKYPIGYIKNNKIILRPPLLILGNYMGFLTKIEDKNVFISNITQKNMINSFDEILKTKNPEFGFFTSCISRRDFLGIKIFKAQEKMKEYFKDKDFLIVYSAGEGTYKPGDGYYFLNETITSVIFSQKNQ